MAYFWSPYLPESLIYYVFSYNHVEPKSTSLNSCGFCALFKGLVLFIHSMSVVHFYLSISGLDLLSRSLSSKGRNGMEKIISESEGESHNRDGHTVLWKQRKKVKLN